MAQLASTLPPGFSSWATELKAYEREKRYDVDPGLLTSRTVRLDNAMISLAEREYDPILQSFRDSSRESAMRMLEKEVRNQHLNRAMDVQLKREHLFNVVTHEGKLRGIQKDGPKPHKAKMPATHLEYNILSNLPFDVHHWAKPEERPQPGQRVGKQRRVPVSGIKDFNVVTNRYLRHHEAQAERDSLLSLLEASDKYRKRGLFHPLTQRFEDPVLEERVRLAEDSTATEVALRAKALQPLSYQGNPQNSYDVVSHEVRNLDMLTLLDEAEKQRSARFSTRHEVEQKIKEEDLAAQDAMAALPYNKIQFQRYEVPLQRGYDILSNTMFGDGPKCVKPYLPHPKPKISAWERALQQGTSEVESGPISGSQTSRQPFNDSAKLSLSFNGSQTARQPFGAGTEGSAAVRDTGNWTAKAESAGSNGDRKTSEGGNMAGSKYAAFEKPVRSGNKAGLAATVDFTTQNTPRTSSVRAAAAPPAPTVPGSALGSVYSRPK